MAAQTPGFHLPPWVTGGLVGAGAGLGATTTGNAAQGEAVAGETVKTANTAFNASSWFLRIGEILAGLVLVGIGLNSMLKGKPLQVVTGAAGVAGKAAML